MFDQLLQSQKMEALGRLVGGIAHDFNNLLTAILGFTELSFESAEGKSPLREYLKAIHESATKSINIIKQLLIFSRKKIAEYTIINLREVIWHILNVLKRVIGEHIEIKIDSEQKLWNIKGDRANIEQVIMNLAINSRDAMPEGGKIIIKTYNKEIKNKGKFVCLHFEDTGIGMDKETISHIFEPFFTTKELGIGTGLGLSVVYEIVKKHGGFIEVESKKIKELLSEFIFLQLNHTL